MTISLTSGDFAEITERVGDPVAVLNNGQVYVKDVTGVSQLFYQTDTGVVTQITPGAGGGMSIGGTVTGGTTGSVLFIGVGPVLAQDNANFFWDDTNNRLGLGTSGPTAPLHVSMAGAAEVFSTDTIVGLQRTTAAAALHLKLIGSTTSQCAVIFGDTANHNPGSIIYENSGDQFRFFAGTVEAARTNSTGDWFFGSGTTPSGTFDVEVESRIGVGDGALATPSYSFRNFTNRGFAVNLATGTFSAISGGVDLMRWDGPQEQTVVKTGASGETTPRLGLGYNATFAGFGFSAYNDVGVVGDHMAVFAGAGSESYSITSSRIFLRNTVAVQGIRFNSTMEQFNIYASNGDAVAAFTGGAPATRGLEMGTAGIGYRLFLADGTAALPGLAFVGDSTMGMSRGLLTTLEFSTAGLVQASLSSPADTETALSVRRDLAGVETVQRVSQGGVDSGGVGFRLLRVPN